MIVQSSQILSIKFMKGYYERFNYSKWYLSDLYQIQIQYKC